MRVLLTALFGLSLLAGCGGNTAYIPGSTGGYESPLLNTERGQLTVGRTLVCGLIEKKISSPEEVETTLINSGGELVTRASGLGSDWVDNDGDFLVSPEEAHRFVDEASAQCDYLRSAEVKNRLLELGQGWVS